MTEFQLKYWSTKDKPDTASVMRTVGNRTSAIIRGLDPISTYYIKLKAYNSAGVGPDSAEVNVTTKRPRKCDVQLTSLDVINEPY